MRTIYTWRKRTPLTGRYLDFRGRSGERAGPGVEGKLALQPLQRMDMMDADSEEPPSKRRRYERSSTPIRGLDPLPPLREDEWGENGLDSVEEPIASDTEQEDTVRPGDDELDNQGPDYFGLSDEAMESFLSEVEEEKQMGVGQLDWAKLPIELWQLIFQRVPLLDLITTGRRVCQRWNQIISDENFLHWKKMYFQLKHCDPATISVVTTILRPLSTSGVNQAQPNGQLFTLASNLIDTNPNFTLVHLARLFAESFPSLSIDLEGVLLMMSRHPQYSCVSQIKDQLSSDGPVCKSSVATHNEKSSL